MTNALALSDYTTYDEKITYHLFKAYKDSYSNKFTKSSSLCDNSHVEHSKDMKFIYKSENKTRLKLAELENDGDINICGNCVRKLYQN